MPRSKSPRVQLWKQPTQTDPPIQICHTHWAVCYKWFKIIFFKWKIPKSKSPHQISHRGKFYFLWKFEINAKVLKSNSENSPLTLTYIYSYTIYTKQYVINGCKLSFFKWKLPKSKSPPNLTQWEILFFTEFKINAKVQKSKSPTLKTALTDWPTYTVIPYTQSSML